MVDALIRDRLVVGLFDEGVKERFFREEELTLKSAMDIIRAIEVAAMQQRKLQETVAIHEIKKDSLWKEPQIRFDDGLKFNCKRLG